MGSRLVFITQEYDPSSTYVGVARHWVAALAARCAGVDVIAQSAVGPPSPDRNIRVFSLGREHGASKRSQLVRFHQSLARVLPTARAVFAHMVPRYALMAFPLATVTRRPVVLWYAQGGVDRNLRLAARLVRWILTPTRDSFPLSGRRLNRRVVVTGHGIDTSRYAPDRRTPPVAGRFLSAGRLSPSKRYELLLDALALLDQRPEWRLRVAGGPLFAPDHSYERRIRAQAAALRIGARVDFAGEVPYGAMPDEYRRAWAMAHTSATGSLDKVVLEAMGCGTPVISTAPVSRQVMGALAGDLWCEPGHPNLLAARLEAALDWTPAQRSDVGAALRYQVERNHSLARWADRVVALLSGHQAPAASAGGVPSQVTG
jgi:glycosyltransferase involved in cell wall biosynthesis